MSFCADSCCTCCRVVSSASATSASSPLAVAARCSASAGHYFPIHRPLVLSRRLTQTSTSARFHSGNVLCAAAIWFWSSGLRPPGSGSALHPRPGLSDMRVGPHCPLTTLAHSICDTCVSAQRKLSHRRFLTAFMASPAPVPELSPRKKSFNTCTRRPNDQPLLVSCDHQTRLGNIQNP